MIELEKAISVVQQAGEKIMEGFGKWLPLSEGKERSDRDTPYDALSLEIICRGLLQYYPEEGLMGEGLKDLALNLKIKLDGREIFPGRSRRIWVIDPLCGTIPYSRGLPDFAISLALVSENPLEILAGIVMDPVHNEIFWAEKGRGSFLNGRLIRISGLKTEKEFKDQGMLSIDHRTIRTPKYTSQVVSLAQKVARLRAAGTCGLELAQLACGRVDVVLRAEQPLYDFAAGLIILLEAEGKATDYDGTDLKLELSYRKATNILASNGKIHDFVVKEFCS